MIRKGNLRDISSVLRIYEDAKSFIKSYNSPQWQSGYPNADTFYDDLENNRLYVYESNNEVVACASFHSYEKDYDNIYEGSWLTTTNNYMAVHTIATNNSYRGKGIAARFFKYIHKNFDVASIRIDTHKLNVPMIKMLEKNGFILCGIIYLSDGQERLAYEKVLK